MLPPTPDLSEAFDESEEMDSLEPLPVRMTPAYQYYISTNKLDSLSVLGILLNWFLALLPLGHGPKSLIKFFFIGFVLIHSLNSLLFFRAISLPGSSTGYNHVLSANFNVYNDKYSKYVWFGVVRMIFGSWFCAFYGSLLVVGKYVKKMVFPVPHVFVAVVACFVLNIFNILKVCAFAGYFNNLLNTATLRYVHIHELETVPVLLSQLPGSTFWLLVYFVYRLGIFLPYLSFTVEVVAVSVTEFFPRYFSADRTEFPKNLVLTALLGFFGSIISIVLQYCSTSVHYYRLTHMSSFLIACSALFIVIGVLVPLAMSRVVNAGRETLLDMVRRQGARSWANSRYTITILIVFLSGSLAYFLPRIAYFAGGLLLLNMNGVAALVTIVIIMISAQCVSFYIHEFTFCRSVGKLVDSYEAANGDEVILMPLEDEDDFMLAP